MKVQFLEIYTNEELHDLLEPASMQIDIITGKPLKTMKIRESKKGEIIVEGLKEVQVYSADQCLQELNRGIGARVTSSTDMNDQSSRSHAIFTIIIEQSNVKDT